MRLEKVVAVLPGAVVTESGVKRALGDRRFSIGDWCWCDGNFVFGHEVASNHVVSVLKKTLDAILLANYQDSKYKYCLPDTDLTEVRSGEFPFVVDTFPMVIVGKEYIYAFNFSYSISEIIGTLYTFNTNIELMNVETIIRPAPQTGYIFQSVDATLDATGVPRWFALWLKPGSEYDSCVFEEFLGTQHVQYIDFGASLASRKSELMATSFWTEIISGMDAQYFSSNPDFVITEQDVRFSASESIKQTNFNFSASLTYCLRNRCVIASITMTLYTVAYVDLRVYFTPIHDFAHVQTNVKQGICDLKYTETIVLGQGSTQTVRTRKELSKVYTASIAYNGVVSGSTILTPQVTFSMPMPQETENEVLIPILIGDGIYCVANCLTDVAHIEVDGERYIDVELSSTLVMERTPAAIIVGSLFFIHYPSWYAIDVYQDKAFLKTVDVDIFNKNLAISTIDK